MRTLLAVAALLAFAACEREAAEREKTALALAREVDSGRAE